LSTDTLSDDAIALGEFKAVDAAGFPDHDELPHKPNTNQTMNFNVSVSLIAGCHFCRSTTNLSRCGGCRVLSYYGQEHRAIDRATHKVACSKIKKEPTKLEAGETAVCAHAEGKKHPPTHSKKAEKPRGTSGNIKAYAHTW
jgi:hypothetical protein